jgi:HPt (histidine-containing phosphotransfer) domain-containing protein
LRSELRGALSGRSAGLARVAALDAALETALRAKERHLLATVPDVLQRHFERLRQAQPMQWLHRYAADMQSVLLAELDLRLQPIEGLLATLNLDLESAGRP